MVLFAPLEALSAFLDERARSSTRCQYSRSGLILCKNSELLAGRTALEAGTYHATSPETVGRWRGRDFFLSGTMALC